MVRVFRDFNGETKHTHIQRCLFHFSDVKEYSEIILTRQSQEVSCHFRYHLYRAELN